MKNIYILLLLSFLLACKKDKLSDNIILKDKSLPIIQKYIAGKWQLLYAYGGFTGNIRKDFIENYITFHKDSILWMSHDTTVANSNITWEKITDIWLKQTYIMKFNDWRNYPYDFIPDRIENGELWLVENAPDGMGYFLKRIQ